jgi:DGQHR domain-containing protein
MNNFVEQLIIRALRTSQGKGVEVFSFFIAGDDIVKIADISRIHRDDKLELKGFQRKEIKKHVNSIVDYLDNENGNALFPNAIILALSPEVEFKQTRGRDPEGLQPVAQAGTLFVPIRSTGDRAAWIVDGQQRALALSKAKNKNIPVPVIAFIAPDLATQREQFILVNKAKPLPTRLINELLPEVDMYLPRDLAVRKLPSELCSLLNRDPKSPFYQRIRQASFDGENDSAVIVDTALIEVFRRSINSPLGVLAQFKGIGEGDMDTMGMYSAINVFWGAVKEIFPTAWQLPPTKSRLTHSAGIRAMGTLMDRIMARVPSQSNVDPVVKQALSRIAPDCCWTEGSWKGVDMQWDEIQNISKHVRALEEVLIKLDFDASIRNQS